jgi:hypothetical protein
MTVYVVMRPGQSFESESDVRGGSTRRHPSPFLTTQYHQLVEPLFAASQASEMLVSELAVIRRFVGALDPPPSLGGGGGGLFAGAAEAATRASASASTRASAAKTVRPDIGAPPDGAEGFTRRYVHQANTDLAAAPATSHRVGHAAAPLPTRPSTSSGNSRSTPYGQEDLAGLIPGLAAGRFALDSVGGDAANTTFDETGPHALVDPVGARAPRDERPERTRRRRELGAAFLERDDGDLKAERTERFTYQLDSSPQISRLLQAGTCAKLAAKVLAYFSQRIRPPASWDFRYEKADQLGQPPVGELDAFQLLRDSVDLCWATRSRTAPAAPSLERDGQESGLNEPIKTTAGNVAVHAECFRCLGGGERIAPASRVQKDAPKLRIARRGKSVQRRDNAIGRHGWENVPVGGSREATSPGSRRRSLATALGSGFR